ncbi:hypothetical protein WA026_006457 [Henosepilachna vigintioctopunctata]|uniref:Ribosome biogenesis protein WDR12 homolog n=1 Tax=Henosepilachna vigintioctopunctata TaxID=420089 RepID=A0AAW1U6U7_9CUCU
MTLERNLSIILKTKQEEFAIPDSVHLVPIDSDEKSLNDLVNGVLKESHADILKRKKFDFICLGELLRTSLDEHLKTKSITTEITLDIEYVLRTPAPAPEDTILHDDWVSGIHTCSDKWILTGCYDNTIKLWTSHGKAITSLKEHTNIVKEVKWISETDSHKGFVSVSHDLTGILWAWEDDTTTAKPFLTLKGHSRGIDCVGVSPNSERLATGGWDTTLKIWSACLEKDIGEPIAKKAKVNMDVRTPLHTLEGHKETISAVSWIDNHDIVTSSMDHTIKIWDAELNGIKNEIVGQKAFLSSSWSPLTKSLLATSADQYIRLYDPRSTEGLLCKTTFTSHTGWVSSVDWSPYSEYLFLSGGYDAKVKLWDTRSSKAPLYDMQGHDGQVLKVDWSNKKYLISGGADNRVHIFKNKDLL